MPNYSFVIDSSFRPFSMQEMLTPYLSYKEAYEKDEAAYNDLTDKSDKFKYLSDTLPEGSKARAIYENYANELKTQADALSRNGLSMANRRALTNLKRRYAGEIGRLETASDALKEQEKLRLSMNAKDSSIIYKNDNLTIDDYLDGNKPDLYNISGNELYAKGAAASKAASSRIFSNSDAGSILSGYYRDYVERMGYTPEQLRMFGEQIMQDFTSQANAIPELQQAANLILDSEGVTTNLSGDKLRQAQQQVIRGIIDGAVYKEDHKPVRDESKISEKERIAQEEQRSLYEAKYNVRWNPETRRYEPVTPSDSSAIVDDNGNYTRTLANGTQQVYDSTTRKWLNVAKPKVSTTDKALQSIIDNNGATNGRVITGDVNGKNPSVINIYTSKQVLPPFYMDAFFTDASNPQIFGEGEKNAFNEGDARELEYDSLHENAKKQVRDYLKKTLPSIVDGLRDNQIDHIATFLDGQMDYDFWSDSHYRIMIPGTNEAGKIVNRDAFNTFLSKVNEYKIQILNGETAEETVEETPESNTNSSGGTTQTEKERAALENFAKIKSQESAKE